ncbi:DUF6286 domain-containing protein [Pseudokineococcus basanitobsidens]|uniref:DUF6286 domain-containing protein n=1 Tax=Pseudokineococcus basanitobsidens TaxID=1926649 RepID=A0ABU8RFG8_9ACTN
MSQTDTRPHETSSGSDPLGAAKAKTGTGPVPVIAIVLAVLLLALAALLVRDGLVALGWVGGTPWLPVPVQGLDGTAPSALVVVVGVVAALVGLWLVVQAFHRRSRKTVAVESACGLFVTTRDVARLSTGAARDVDGVMDASSSAGRRSVTVQVTTTGDAAVAEAVRAAVTDRLSVLDPTPKVRVRTTSNGSSS